MIKDFSDNAAAHNYLEWQGESHNRGLGHTMTQTQKKKRKEIILCVILHCKKKKNEVHPKQSVN